MIYTSNKPQAKRITTRTWSSSTDITNIQKELLRVQVSLLSHYLQLLKKLVSGPCRALLNLYFFIIKSNKQQASSQQLAVSLFFFYSKKQQATSQQRAHLLTLDI